MDDWALMAHPPVSPMRDGVAFGRHGGGYKPAARGGGTAVCPSFFSLRVARMCGAALALGSAVAAPGRVVAGRWRIRVQAAAGASMLAVAGVGGEAAYGRLPVWEGKPHSGGRRFGRAGPGPAVAFGAGATSSSLPPFFFGACGHGSVRRSNRGAGGMSGAERARRRRRRMHHGCGLGLQEARHRELRRGFHGRRRLPTPFFSFILFWVVRGATRSARPAAWALQVRRGTGGGQPELQTRCDGWCGAARGRSALAAPCGEAADRRLQAPVSPFFFIASFVDMAMWRL